MNKHWPEKELLATPRFRVVAVEKPEGGVKEVVRHPGAVVILPLVNADQVCLIRNYRVSVAQTLIELPAGTLEPGEPADETARRELIEETGYRCASIRCLHSFFLSPGILDELMHLFVAEGLTAGDPAREPGEQIENHICSWSEAMDLVDRGQIRDAKTLTALLIWDRLRGRSR
jgi:ADP-ribose pyrophosphatase